MANYGYIFLANKYAEKDEDRKWMTDFGCESIETDTADQDKLRPALGKLMDRLKTGDTIVVSRFCNIVHGSRELNFFLEFCKSNNIRIVSINDRIDSLGLLFPETTAADVLNVFASLPSMIVEQRGLSNASKKVRLRAHRWNATLKKRDERSKLIINMYNTGYSIAEIQHASGLRSRSALYDVLNKAGVELNRGHTRGPLGPRKKKDIQ